MGYKQGTVRGSSIALLVFSFILLVFYIGCTNSCRYESTSLYSPIWTSLWGIAIASLGIGMAVSKTENKWGGCFLALCIVCILMSLGCMILSFATAIVEISSIPPRIEPTYVIQPTPSPLPSPSPTPTFNRDVAIILWLCMTGTTGVMTIIAIVASCMYCCCQAPAPVVTETRYVFTGEMPSTGQTIVLNNQEFILQPTGTTTIVAEDQPPPYSSVVSPYAPVNFSQSGIRPIPELRPDEYMQLQHNSNTTAATSVTNATTPENALDVDSGEYAYVDCNDDNRVVITSEPTNVVSQTPGTRPLPPLRPDEYMQLQRQENDTSRPDEYMQLQRDDNPTASTSTTRAFNKLSVNPPTATHSSEYAYVDCDNENIHRERVPTPDECYDDVGEPQNSTSSGVYAYASSDDLRTPVSNEDDRRYQNSGVQRPAVSNSQPGPSIPDYLEVLP